MGDTSRVRSYCWSGAREIVGGPESRSRNRSGVLRRREGAVHYCRLATISDETLEYSGLATLPLRLSVQRKTCHFFVRGTSSAVESPSRDVVHPPAKSVSDGVARGDAQSTATDAEGFQTLSNFPAAGKSDLALGKAVPESARHRRGKLTYRLPNAAVRMGRRGGKRR
jgi:hypothetical protein